MTLLLLLLLLLHGGRQGGEQKERFAREVIGGRGRPYTHENYNGAKPLLCDWSRVRKPFRPAGTVGGGKKMSPKHAEEPHDRSCRIRTSTSPRRDGEKVEDYSRDRLRVLE